MVLQVFMHVTVADVSTLCEFIRLPKCTGPSRLFFIERYPRKIDTVMIVVAIDRVCMYTQHIAYTASERTGMLDLRVNIHHSSEALQPVKCYPTP